jgi:hypothetical protein
MCTSSLAAASGTKTKFIVSVGFKRKTSDASGSSISKDNAAPQSSSAPTSTTTTIDLGSGNPHQTPPPTTIDDTNVSVTQAEGQETN